MMKFPQQALCASLLAETPSISNKNSGPRKIVGGLNYLLMERVMEIVRLGKIMYRGLKLRMQRPSTDYAFFAIPLQDTGTKSTVLVSKWKKMHILLSAK